MKIPSNKKRTQKTFLIERQGRNSYAQFIPAKQYF